PAGLEQACRAVGELASLIEDHRDHRQLSDCVGIEGDYFLLPQYVVPPAPSASSQPECVVGVFWEQFGDALGVELTSVDPATREACAVKIARLFKRCMGGLQQSLNLRDEIAAELRSNLPDITHQSVGVFKAATSEALIDSLLDDEPADLVTEGVIARAFRELQAHEAAMLAGCRVMAQATLEHFSPQQLGWQFERDRGRPWLLTDGRQWRDYVRHHQSLEGSGQWGEHLLARNFGPAYEQQFLLITAFYQDLQE
ncbi:type VI secretion system-associated FHA domain protein, partial [Pseudomonas syringae]